MQTLYKKDARQFVSVFVRKLDIADYKEARSNFEKYLRQNKMECIVTDTEKIVYAYGKKVKDYINYELSDYLKELANNEHFGGMRSSYLEIVKDVHVKRNFYCEPLKSMKAIGCIVFFFKPEYNDQAFELLMKTKY